MADFVSRSKVEFELCGGNLPEKYKAFIRRVLNDKNLIPPADVAPVTSGEKVDVGGFYFRCSECGRLLPFDGNYCPYCGVSLRGGDSDGR